MKIAIIDDHQILSESLKASLIQRPEIIEINTYCSVTDFFDNASKIQPDVVIVDMMMPNINGLQFIEMCKSKYAVKLNIVVLTSISDVQIIKQAIRAGAGAYLCKNTTLDELVIAIEHVVSNKQYIAKSLRNILLEHSFLDDKINYQLSNREKEVLQRVCSGQTIKEIAHELKLSHHTIQTFHRNVMRKFKVNRIADLIVFAMQNGLYIPEIK